MKYVHTNIVAKDWRSLSKFYINVFNCRIRPPERDYSGAWLDRATGLKNAKLAGVHLVLPGYDDNGPTLEIFTYEHTYQSPLKMANYTGFTHIAFEVEDVEIALNLALDNGASLLGAVTEKKIVNVGILKFVYFRDPEGNIIELQSFEAESIHTEDDIKESKCRKK